MSKLLAGIFPVLQTPVDAGGHVLPADLEREVRFCIDAGAHGLVFPALGSELQYLSDGERHALLEVVVHTAAGQIPVVAGVSAPTTGAAVEHSRHAARIGADAVIALPPYVTAGTPHEILDYYRAIGRAAARPVFVQNTAPGMDPTFLLRLLDEVPELRYIKEEAPPSAHHVSAVVGAAGGRCDGVFGGAFGRWMISEMRRGARGFMPAAELTDVYVRLWQALEDGEEQIARSIFNRLLPLINLLMLLGLRVSKEVLVGRGIFTTAGMLAPGSLALDDDDRYELAAILADLQPLYLVHGA